MSDKVTATTTYLVIGSKLEDGRDIQLGPEYITARTLKKLILTERELERIIRTKLLTGGQKAQNLASLSAVAVAAPKKPLVEEKPRAPPVETVPPPPLWVEKYAPHKLEEITGNPEVIDALTRWLKEWDNVVLNGNKQHVEFQFKKGMSREDIPNPNARACLVSGPPGVGKSAAVRLLAESLGFEILETNASDRRNKRVVEELLCDASGNKTISSYTEAGDKPAAKDKRALIMMDEVDGVSGNSDRGGIQALIRVIRNTKVPIVCLCNDRQHPKVRSLASHCFDVRFAKPNSNMVKRRLQDILRKEKATIDDTTLNFLIETSGNDLRQMINTLQLYSKSVSGISTAECNKRYAGSITNRITNNAKDQSVMLTAYEAAQKMFNRYSGCTLMKRLSLFFVDFEMIPLIIHENYLTPYGSNRSELDLAKMAESAEYISLGDCLDRVMRNENLWELLPDVGTCSSVAPAMLSAATLYVARFPQYDYG